MITRIKNAIISKIIKYKYNLMTDKEKDQLKYDLIVYLSKKKEGK